MTDAEVGAAKRRAGEAHYRRWFANQEEPDHRWQAFVGLLGQVVAADHYGVDPFAEEDRDHDVTVNGRTVDFKTHAAMEDSPYLGRLALLRAPLMQAQRCDAVAWVELTLPMKRAWLYGWLPKAEYRARASLVRVGQNYHGFRPRGADTYALPYRELNPPGALG